MTATSPLAMDIRSAQGDYRVAFWDRSEAMAAAVHDLPGRKLALVDRRLRVLHPAVVHEVLGEIPAYEVDATEDNKSWEGAGRVLLWLQSQRCDRQTCLVVMGGGILQDLATVVAHLFYRGIRWVFAPTTLLAMCDSCIGAKGNINLGSFKNQVGAFHSPTAVHIFPPFLDTLSPADIASGYGEILKLSLTASGDTFGRLRRILDDVGLLGPHLPGLIRESLLIKKGIIEEDEYERGPRLKLNYGHTFGHALESVSGYAVPHGLAVAWGLDLVNFIAAAEGSLAEPDFLAIHGTIAKHLPVRTDFGGGAQALLDAVRRDKKAADGEVRLIMLRRPGTLEITRRPIDAQLRARVDDYLRRHPCSREVE